MLRSPWKQFPQRWVWLTFGGSLQYAIAILLTTHQPQNPAAIDDVLSLRKSSKTLSNMVQ